MMLILAATSGAYFKSIFLVERWRFALFQAHYEKCREAAVPFGNGNAFALCENYDRGGYADGIAYDSSDEISLPIAIRSSAWMSVAKLNPMFKKFNFVCNKIGPHFYYVNFDTLNSPPFIPLTRRR